ncbi:MAG: S4 domain-containing protein [Erythrobacter sp.]
MSAAAREPAKGELAQDAARLRIDRILVNLRLARTRSAARALVEDRALRCNRKRVLRASDTVAIGDVLTVALGREVRVIKLLALPERRASPARAREMYRELDPQG